MAYDYIVIGSGIAGVSAAKAIRKEDSKGSILILGDEDREPYFRIELTHLLAQEAPELPLLEKGDWKEKLKIACRFGVCVEAVDFETMTLRLEGGEILEGKKILIANGSHAMVPPFENKELPGVLTLRNFDDLLHIQEALRDAKRVGVIGGGLLGLEAAKSLKMRGHEVLIVDMEEHLLSKQLDDTLGAMLDEEMKRNGYELYLNAATRGFRGKERVEAMEFSDGRLVEVDAVLISIGVRPNTELFKGTELEINRGVVVDRHLKTSVPEVWAAGDVAEVEGRTLGIWPASRAMGKVAGANMAGGDATYEDPKLFTKLDIGEMEIFSAGKITGDEIYAYDEGKEHHRLYAEDGILVGVVLYGNTKKMGLYRKLVEGGAPIAEALDAGYPFKKQ